MTHPTQERVRQYYNYDPEIGRLVYRLRDRSEFRSSASYSKHKGRVGMPAGCVDKQGYSVVHVDGNYYKAHKIIWLHVFAEWVKFPDFEIDHINGIRDDNRLQNLRKCTKTENQRNASQRVNNTSGVHGVNWKPTYDQNNGGRWVARIWNGPRHVYLGSFKSLQEASIARKAAERVLGHTGSHRKSVNDKP